ncbi:MAG: guanylate kinase [Burkholderia sp.]|nr:guanylate kinase [Burkholderia sp.]
MTKSTHTAVCSIPSNLSNISSYPGNLFIVVAPSGAGKSTLINEMLVYEKDIFLSISCTTRNPRPNELNGQHYHFITIEDFLNRHANKEFLESAEVHGNYYGTPRICIEEHIKNGRDVLLEIDWQGAQQVKNQFYNAISIFILPPSLNALEERLKKRGHDVESVIKRRLIASRNEMIHVSESEYVIINDDFDRALSELRCIITTYRLRFTSQYVRYTQSFKELGINFPDLHHVG